MPHLLPAAIHLQGLEMRMQDIGTSCLQKFETNLQVPVLGTNRNIRR